MISIVTRSYISSKDLSIKAFFGSQYVGTLETLSWQIIRTGPAPVYTMGTYSTEHFRKSITGNISFSQFDYEPFARVMSLKNHFVNEIDDLRPKHKEMQPWYEDQILPFDIVLIGIDEHGISTMKISEVELMNQGYGVFIGDVVSKHNYTYIAKYLFPWQREEDPDQGMIINPFTGRKSWL